MIDAFFNFVGAVMVITGRVVSTVNATLVLGEVFQLSSTNIISKVFDPSGRFEPGVKL